MKRAPITVGELVKLLMAYQPDLQVRMWDMGWGDHVPVVELNVEGPFLFVEGATKEEMTLGEFQ